MNISHDKPPHNLAYLCGQKFDLTGKNPIWAYGDTIYNPGGFPISYDLVAHETVHGARQGDDPEGWWVRYLEDPEFRFKEELVAYRAQYQFIKLTNKDRELVARALMNIARDLSGPMYGSICSFDEAVKAIRAA